MRYFWTLPTGLIVSAVLTTAAQGAVVSLDTSDSCQYQATQQSSKLSNVPASVAYGDDVETEASLYSGESDLTITTDPPGLQMSGRTVSAPSDKQRQFFSLTVSWHSTDPYLSRWSCVFSESKTINLYSLPRPKPKLGIEERWHDDGDSELRVHASTGLSGRRCEATDEDRFTVYVQRGRTKSKSTLDDVCNLNWDAGVSIGDLQISSDPYQNDGDLMLTVDGHRSGEKTYKIAVYKGGRTYLTRFATVTTRYTPRRKIWEYSDSFYNYCLKNGKQTYSKHGLLYCEKSAKTERSWYVRRRR